MRSKYFKYTYNLVKVFQQTQYNALNRRGKNKKWITDFEIKKKVY